MTDLETIAAHVALDSPRAALALLDEIRARARTLETSPARGRRVPELARHGLAAWRELIVGPYRLVYEIASRDVHVMAVVDGRRDLQDLLLERAVR